MLENILGRCASIPVHMVSLTWSILYTIDSPVEERRLSNGSVEVLQIN